MGIFPFDIINNKMRKYILIVVIAVLGINASAQSYDNAIGLRGGVASGVTFKHMLGDNAGFELIAASRWKGFSFTALYEVHAQAFDVEGLNWYYGGGAHVGSWRGYKNHPYFDDGRSYTIVGIDGIVGIEYNITEIPINISIDYKPAFNLVGYTGFWGDNGALSVRYYF